MAFQTVCPQTHSRVWENRSSLPGHLQKGDGVQNTPEIRLQRSAESWGLDWRLQGLPKSS